MGEVADFINSFGEADDRMLHQLTKPRSTRKQNNMPVLKKKVATKVSKAKFAVDALVQFDNDGELVLGSVTALNKDGTIEVTDDEGNAFDIPAEDVQPREEDEPKEPAPTKKAGTAAKKKKGGGDSLASAFNKAKPAAVGGGLPEGQFEALITGAEVRKDDNGTFVDFEATLVNTDDAEHDGRTGRMSYMLLDADGDEAPGMGYFKRDLALLGQETEFEDDDEFEAALEGLAEEEPWMSITVKQNKQGYSNIYLNGLQEDQEDKPERPA